MDKLKDVLEKIEQLRTDQELTGKIPPTISEIPKPVNLELFGIYERYRNVTFNSLNIPEQNKTQYEDVKSYADNLQEHIRKGTGLILKGPVGTGKTTLAIAVLRKAIEMKIGCFFIPMVSLLDTILTQRDKEEAYKFEQRLRNSRLLVLDDLGAEYGKDWVTAKVDSIVTERYNRMLPIIITTNLALRQVAETEPLGMAERYNARIIDRLRSTSKIIGFTGNSLREEEYM